MVSGRMLEVGPSVGNLAVLKQSEHLPAKSLPASTQPMPCSVSAGVHTSGVSKRESLKSEAKQTLTKSQFKQSGSAMFNDRKRSGRRAPLGAAMCQGFFAFQI